MIKLIRCLCPWCSKPVHGVLKANNEIHGECDVCYDNFVMPMDVTKKFGGNMGGVQWKLRKVKVYTM